MSFSPFSQKWDKPTCMSLPYAQVLQKYTQLKGSRPSFVTLDPKTNQLTMCTEISLHQDMLYKDNKLNPVLSKAMEGMKAASGKPGSVPSCSKSACKPCKAKKSIV